MWWWVSLQVLRHQAGALGWPRGGGRRHLRVFSHCRCFLSGALALLATVLHVCTSGDFLGQLFQKKAPASGGQGRVAHGAGVGSWKSPGPSCRLLHFQWQASSRPPWDLSPILEASGSTSLPTFVVFCDKSHPNR